MRANIVHNAATVPRFRARRRTVAVRSRVIIITDAAAPLADGARAIHAVLVALANAAQVHGNMTGL